MGSGLPPYVTLFDWNGKEGVIYPRESCRAPYWEPNCLEVQFGSDEVDGLPCEGATGLCDGVRFADRGLSFRSQKAPGAAAQRRFGWSCGTTPQDHPSRPGWVQFYEAGVCKKGNSTWHIELPDGPWHVWVSFGRFHTSTSGCWLNGHEAAHSWWGPLHGSFTQDYYTVVTRGRVEISGDAASCCALKQLRLERFVIPVGNVTCWDGAFQYHTCCLTEESRARCFPQDLAPLGMTYEACCRRQAASQSWRRLPLSRHQPRGCFPPYCQTHCLGPLAEHYRDVPSWIRSTPYPDPLVCGDVKLWPLTISVPRHLVVECLPPKAADFALLRPGDNATYIFGDDVAEYFRSYREALFAVTRPKSGPDTCRHTEILASGAVPYFQHLFLVPNRSMPHHHRGLLQKALLLPGVVPGVVFDEAFDADMWLDVASRLLHWTTHRLTTVAMAIYMLWVLGVPRSSYNKTRVLFVNRVDCVTSVLLLHGLREVLEEQNVVDFPRSRFYEPNSWPLGRGSVPAEHGDPYLGVRWALPQTPVFAEGESEVLAALAAGHFDYAFFGRMPAQGEPMTRVEQAALDLVPKDRLVLADGYDHMPTRLLTWARRMGTTFKYQLTDTCPPT